MPYPVLKDERLVFCRRDCPHAHPATLPDHTIPWWQTAWMMTAMGLGCMAIGFGLGVMIGAA